MAQLVANCARCGSQKTTCDTQAQKWVSRNYDWQDCYEVFSICRHCGRSTVFVLGISEPAYAIAVKEGALIERGRSANDFATVEGYVSVKDTVSTSPPEHLPANIASAFNEGATCLAVNCYKAAAAMLRLCIDLATRPLLPEEDETL